MYFANNIFGKLFSPTKESHFNLSFLSHVPIWILPHSLYSINKIIVFFLVPCYHFGSVEPVVDWLQILEEDQFENQQ